MNVALQELIDAAEAALSDLERRGIDTGTNQYLMDLRDAVECAKMEL